MSHSQIELHILWGPAVPQLSGWLIKPTCILCRQACPGHCHCHFGRLRASLGQADREGRGPAQAMAMAFEPLALGTFSLG